MRPFRRAGSNYVAWGFAIHEVVADHVADVHVSVFDAPHVRHGNLNVELSLGAEFAAVAAGQGNGAAADGVGVVHGQDHVRVNYPNR